jgi:hypothetical protein
MILPRSAQNIVERTGIGTPSLRPAGVLISSMNFPNFEAQGPVGPSELMSTPNGVTQEFLFSINFNINFNVFHTRDVVHKF